MSNDDKTVVIVLIASAIAFAAVWIYGWWIEGKE